MKYPAGPAVRVPGWNIPEGIRRRHEDISFQKTVSDFLYAGVFTRHCLCEFYCPEIYG